MRRRTFIGRTEAIPCIDDGILQIWPKNSPLEKLAGDYGKSIVEHEEHQARQWMERENLEDIIYNISPQEPPFLSSVAKSARWE